MRNPFRFLLELLDALFGRETDLETQENSPYRDTDAGT